MRKYMMVLLAVILVAAVALTGCGQKGTKSTKTSAVENAVAEVNGKKITQEEFNNYMQMQVGATELSNLLNERIILGIAEEKDVTPTDSEVEARLNVMKKTSDLDELKKQKGWADEDLKSQIKVSIASENVAVKMMGDKINDKAVKAKYDQDKSTSYVLPERVKADLAAFRNQSTAEEAAKKIKDGQSMEAACSSAEGPVRSLTFTKDQIGMPPELLKAVFDTPVGKSSGAIKVSTGIPGQPDFWLIVKPTDVMKPVTITFDEAKASIKGQIALEMAQQDPTYIKEMRAARKSADVKVLDPKLKEIEKTFAGK